MFSGESCEIFTNVFFIEQYWGTISDSSGRYLKYIQIYIKDIKITLIKAILATPIPTWNMFLSVAITLEAAIQNSLSKSRIFSREIYVVEFRYSATTAFWIHNNFTYDSEIYDIVKLYSDSLKLYLSLTEINS